MAEDLVSATSGLLDGRIINIMNPDGIIIASTQPERIGTFHKGARNAAVSGKPVSIRPDQIQEYSGAREGYNMPLRVGGNIIGVVGIYGEPSEIRYLAHLVEVYTEKYYQLEALIRPQYAQGALKSILLSKLLEGSAKSIAEAETLIKSRNLTLRYPVRVLDWIGENFAPGEVLVSLMRQYTPMGGLPAPFDRRVTDEEYDAVLSWMYLNELEGFTQEAEAADTGFIPDFLAD